MNAGQGETVRDAMAASARVNAWIGAMQAYRTGYSDGYDDGAEAEARRLKALYVDGLLTIEAFEAKLDFAFGLRRETNETVSTP